MQGTQELPPTPPHLPELEQMEVEIGRGIEGHRERMGEREGMEGRERARVTGVMLVVREREGQRERDRLRKRATMRKRDKERESVCERERDRE